MRAGGDLTVGRYPISRAFAPKPLTQGPALLLRPSVYWARILGDLNTIDKHAFNAERGKQGDIMRALLGLLASIILLVSAAGTAGAAALRPAGKYAFTSFDSCEAKFTFTFGSYRTAGGTTDNAVRVINSVVDGDIGNGVGYITFTPTSATGGNFSYTATDVHGGALRINNGGVNVKTETQTASGSYTFTATTFTLSPTGESVKTFAMAYGALNANGAPSSVHLVRKDSSGETNNCVQGITATR
jgi:hypothetical protein